MAITSVEDFIKIELIDCCRQYKRYSDGHTIWDSQRVAFIKGRIEELKRISKKFKLDLKSIV